MKDSYITVLRNSETEIVISKSRFIGRAFPCRTEAEALSCLNQVRNENPGARHNCYAYVIGENSGIMRYSDDGEPGGTAGLPIMDAIRLKHIVNCCIVVTRYFGGVLLGTGGLVRAYSQSAHNALEAAGIARMELTCDYFCELPYACWDRFRYAIEHLPVKMERVEYGGAICFHLMIRSRESEEVLASLMETSGRQLVSMMDTESFLPWELQDEQSAER